LAPLFSPQHLAPEQILGNCELRDVMQTLAVADASLHFSS